MLSNVVVTVVLTGAVTLIGTGVANLVGNFNVNVKSAGIGSGYAADQCKNNGWKNNFPAGTFKNQGDCVSFFASGGRNQPAG